MLGFERWQEPQLAIDAALDRLQSRLWTKLPCVVTAVTADGQHVTVQPTIMGLQRNVDASGNVTWTNIQLPLLPQVPVKFPSGGGFTMTFPVAVGDEGTVAFSSRCIDNWWQQGGIQPQLAPNGVGSARKHDLSDGFFELGGRSMPRILSGVSSSAVQLRSDDGTCYMEFNESHFKVVFPGGTFMIDSSGNVTSTGDVSSQSGGNAVSLTNHLHTGIKPGTGISAVPKPGT